MPPWMMRQGESWFSFRNPASSLYLTFGGHVGLSTDTTLRQVGSVGCSSGFAIGCDPFAPTGDLGVGGGGSFGLGARLTPVFRVAVVVSGEGGYRTDASVVQPPSFVSYVQTRIAVSSFQASTNLYADLGGILNTGRWNPFVMAGVGVAANRTGDVFFNKGFVGSPPTDTVVNAGSGQTSTNFLWTAGAGLQYQLTPGSTLEVSYQYVDAGSFRVDVFASEGFPNFNVIEGNLRTHRIGVGVTIAINHLAQLITGR